MDFPNKQLLGNKRDAKNAKYAPSKEAPRQVIKGKENTTDVHTVQQETIRYKL